MIKGIVKQSIPYVLEEDRMSDNPTVFWIKPKDGHMMNLSAARYAPAAREWRGHRELDVKKLDIADVEEFIATVEKVENFQFDSTHSFYSNFPNGVVKETTDENVLKEICRSLSAAHLSEIWEVAADISKLKAGEKKKLNLSSGSDSGKTKSTT